MPRPQTQLEALTPGQLAKRWGIGVDRVRRLVDSGQIPGAFRIPGVGRYGEAIKIPLAAVIEREQEWAIAPAGSEPRRKPRASRNGSPPKLKHFPELNQAESVVAPRTDHACTVGQSERASGEANGRGPA